MKIKFFLGAMAMILAMVFSTNIIKNSSDSELANLFSKSDNIAFADGYTCAPKTWSGCPFGSGNLYDYIKVVPNDGGGGTK